MLGNRNDSEIGDLIFMIRGFDDHHINNKSKTGNWNIDSINELGAVFLCMVSLISFNGSWTFEISIRKQKNKK